MENTKQSHPARNSIPLIVRFEIDSGARYQCVGVSHSLHAPIQLRNCSISLPYCQSVPHILCLCHLTHFIVIAIDIHLSENKRRNEMDWCAQCFERSILTHRFAFVVDVFALARQHHVTYSITICSIQENKQTKRWSREIRNPSESSIKLNLLYRPFYIRHIKANHAQRFAFVPHCIWV